MKRIVMVAVVVVLVISLAGTASIAFAQDDSDDADDGDDVTPGEHMSGVVGVQNAEFGGELAERGLRIGLEQADSNASKADIIQAHLEEVEQRIDDLETHKQDLSEAREGGDISVGQYNAAIAALETERATAERIAHQSQHAAEQLPRDLLEERGIDVEAIDELRERANELGGDEVSDIAQGIAGSTVGETISDQVPDVGPSDDAEEDEVEIPSGEDADSTDDNDDEDEDDDNVPASDVLDDDDDE